MLQFIDSHCHINFSVFAGQMPHLQEEMRQHQVTHALVVSVNLPDFPSVLACAASQDNLFASVGVHPDYEDEIEPTVAQLCQLAQHEKVVAIGETGLDYFRLAGDLSWQRARFRTHIQAAKSCAKPLIIHTRQAAEDTIRIMQEENAAEVGGVMHCFTESLAVAEAAIAQNFYISFSGILTFKNALALKEVAQHIPLERILIETDSPYLAPSPHRGKQNQPAWVRHIAEELAVLRGVSLDTISQATTANFARLFKVSV